MNRRQELIAQVREVAARLGRDKLSRRQFSRASGAGEAEIYRLFEGGWSELCRLAGVACYRTRSEITDDEYFAAMRKTFLAFGGVPSRQRFLRRFEFSPSPMLRRGRGWHDTLVLCRAWLEKNDPGFPYLDQLPGFAPPSPAGPSPERLSTDEGGRLRQDRLFGDYLGFRAMSHAPTGEGGAMVLFGMVAEELGFRIELVTRSYPDCEALRRVVDPKTGAVAWRRVRIEFEFRSRNFRDHGHDPRGCDLIVCWEHDWTDGCPLPVLELKAEIGKLNGGR
jgi:hypothetical protein